MPMYFSAMLSSALENANVDIVGGDGQFFDRLVGAVSLGKSVDKFVDHSAVARSLAGPWLEGSANPVEDLTKLLGSVNSGDVSNAALSALLLQQVRAGVCELVLWHACGFTMVSSNCPRPVSALVLHR